MYTLRDTKINAYLIAFLVFMFAFRDHAASEVSYRFPRFYYGISATTNKTEKYTCQHAHVRLVYISIRKCLKEEEFFSLLHYPIRDLQRRPRPTLANFSSETFGEQNSGKFLLACLVLLLITERSTLLVCSGFVPSYKLYT